MLQPMKNMIMVKMILRTPKILLLLCLFVFGNVYAQQPAGNTTIRGRVLDTSSEKVLEYAAVTLHQIEDGKVLEGTVTNAAGSFELKATPGTYFVQVKYLSFEPFKTKNIEVKEGIARIDLGEIGLVAIEVSLDEVEITADKSPMEFKLDKRVFNVQKDATNLGRNVSEILDQLPSVNVDLEGNVSLRGSENVRILVNGRQSGLVGISSPDALRQLQGELIERIEVITNPSARYDAEGEVGIINLVLKKEKRKGVNGSIGLNVGEPANYGSSYSLNFRRNKINLFSSFGIRYRVTPGSGSLYQERTLLDSVLNEPYTLIAENDRTRRRTGLSGNLRFGADVELNPYNSISGAFVYRKGGDLNNNLVTYRDYNRFGDLIRTTLRTDEETEDELDVEGQINYVRTFKQKGRKFTIDFQWEESEETELSDFEETTDANGTPLIQRSSNSDQEREIVFQTDYIHPVGKDGKFEAGAKASIRRVKNVFLVEERQLSDAWVTLPDFNDELDYDENILAAYTIYGDQIKAFSYQLGLRAEYTGIRTALLRTNYENPRNFFGLFPSAHLSYKFSEASQFQVSYSRRLSRPRFRSLIPFATFSDRRNNYRGNPDLNPEFTNSYEIGYLRYWDKGSLMSSVYHRNRQGVVERIIDIDINEDGDFITTRFPVNLSTQNSIGIEFNLSQEVGEWWQLSGNFNFYRAITEGTYNGTVLRADALTWQSRLNSKMKLWKMLEFQQSFNYRAPRNTTQGRYLAAYNLDLSLATDVLKGKGTVTANVRDVFNTRRYISITEQEDFFARSEFQWSRTQFTLGFTYRINRKKSRREGRTRQFEGGGEPDF